jgi:hypothetical protein
VPETRVTSWRELNDWLYESSWRETIGRFRSSYAFRGMASTAHDLRTSLARLGGRTEELEGHILRNFRKYASREVVPGDSIWNWMAVAQHHGLPTRLLDWTYSPFIALHYVTEFVDDFDLDGVIWSVDFTRTNQLLPESLRLILADEGSDVFTAEMLSRVAGSLRDFDRLSASEFVVFFEPPSLDDRIVNQSALFSLMGDPKSRLDSWLSMHPELCRRAVIPHELKWEIRDKLDQANITERVLYPGLDGLSRYLKRYYTPKRQ